jgi:predicted O-methyltransferase YrrM
VIRATGALRNFLISLGKGMFPPSYVVMETASGFWIAKAMGVAADLELADILKEGPMTIGELANRTQTHPASLLRLMRVLTGNGIFKQRKDGTFSNNKLSMALTEDSNSMKSFIRHHLGANNWDFVGDLEQCVRTGENAISRLTGQEPFDYLKNHPEKSLIFDRAMTDSNEMSLPLFLAAYNFGKYKKIIDVGGGQGYMVSAIAAKYPGVKCIVFDQPHVVHLATENFARFEVQDQCRFIEGSFFEKVPEGGQLYILKNILHDWDDDTCIRILKNIHDAMPAGAHILIIDALIEDNNKNSFGKILDLQMLIGMEGGRERTRHEFETVLNAAGFGLLRTIDTATPFSFIEGVKRER